MLYPEIKAFVGKTGLSKYNDSMPPLIKKDIDGILKLIGG